LIALPDVNVLLALAWTNHVHHDAAHRWFSSASANGWATCVLTQSAFLRLSMNPHVVHATIDCATARQLLSGLVATRSINSLPIAKPSRRVRSTRWYYEFEAISN
jgi:toxin-antitoxin system PIN domain toxin